MHGGMELNLIPVGESLKCRCITQGPLSGVDLLRSADECDDASSGTLSAIDLTPTQI
jgi:hypothetical protein